jgi:hypothetical protein
MWTEFSSLMMLPIRLIILDCIDEAAKAFYQRWDFRELPGRPMRLFLPFSSLTELMSAKQR